MAMVDEDLILSPPKKRSRAGRPRAGDTEEKFDLLSYLEERRPGMYRFLEEAEATQRLPLEKKKNPRQITAEMAKHPVQ